MSRTEINPGECRNCGDVPRPWEKLSNGLCAGCWRREHRDDLRTDGGQAADSGRGCQHASEDMTVAELLALCGSSNHESGDKTFGDLLDVLGEAHPAVAGKLVEHQRRALDDSTGSDRGTASASEHPEWHDSLERAKQASDGRCPDE